MLGLGLGLGLDTVGLVNITVFTHAAFHAVMPTEVLSAA